MFKMPEEVGGTPQGMIGRKKTFCFVFGHF